MRFPTAAFALVAVALSVAPAGAGPAGGGSASTLLVRIDAVASHLETLSADFTQRNRVKLFKQEMRSTGRLAYERPRRIRWEYLTPDPSALVLDGDRATLRTPGAAPQVFDLARDQAMRTIFDQILLWLGAGSVQAAERDYQIAASGGTDAPVLALVPRAGTAAAKAVARVELRFDKGLTLRGILLREASGDEKEIVFTRLERNKPLPADSFK